MWRSIQSHCLIRLRTGMQSPMPLMVLSMRASCILTMRCSSKLSSKLLYIMFGLNFPAQQTNFTPDLLHKWKNFDCYQSCYCKLIRFHGCFSFLLSLQSVRILSFLWVMKLSFQLMTLTHSCCLNLLVARICFLNWLLTFVSLVNEYWWYFYATKFCCMLTK